jgi:hypothetical protein
LQPHLQLKKASVATTKSVKKSQFEPHLQLEEISFPFPLATEINSQSQPHLQLEKVSVEIYLQLQKNIKTLMKI